jgi:Flp pilus assembly protein TadG
MLVLTVLARRTRAQIALILTLVLPVVLGAVLLGADFAVMYYNWGLLQKAADSAALAGASYLPGSTAQAKSTANTYARLNGAGATAGDTITITVDGAASPHWVQVQLTRVQSYYFGKLVGLKTATVGATAKAGIVVPCSTAGSGHLIPIGIDCATSTCYTPGQVITLTQAQLGPGNWGPLSLPGMSGTSNMETVTANGWTSPNPSDATQILTVNSAGCATSNPGCATMQPGIGGVQAILRGVTDRINTSNSLALGDSWQNPNPADPRVVEVPMVNYAGVTGASVLAPITGFAEAWLIGGSSGNGLQIIFISAVAPGNIPGGTCQSFGTYRALLLQ